MCYELWVLAEATKPAEQKQLYDEIVERIKKKNLFQDEYDVEEPEFLKIKKKKHCRSRSRRSRSRSCRNVLSVIETFKNDIATIWELTTRVKINAKLIDCF